jgi:hypothetical protein
MSGERDALMSNGKFRAGHQGCGLAVALGSLPSAFIHDYLS